MEHVTEMIFASGISLSAVADFFKDNTHWFYIGAGALVMLLIVLIVARLGRRRHNRIFSNKQTDVLAEVGNKKFLRNCYDHRISSYRKHYCFAYIAFDAHHLEHLHGTEKCKDLQRIAIKLLDDASGTYDYIARIEDGAFVLCFRWTNIAHSISKISEIVGQFNQYEYNLVSECCSPAHAGLYQLGENEETFDQALSNVCLAYNNACNHKDDCCVCTQELIRNEASRSRLHTKLSHAIDREQFVVFLQFIYNIDEGKFTSAEVLSRWDNPDDGFLMPSRYIDDMRNTGVIGKFDYYIIDKTCQLLQRWKADGHSDLSLSCNVTRITISEDDFLQKFRSIVKKYDFDPSKLILEITEDALIDNLTIAYRNITDLKTAGFKIAIDDFGAGHSSISDLCDYPVDLIKIDRQLILKSSTERGKALIDGVVDLAHKLGIAVVCEGVETEEQNKIVIKNGCDFIQGYYYSYVFSVEEAMEHYHKSLITL